MELNIQNTVYALFDEACLIYADAVNVSYLEALAKIADFISGTIAYNEADFDENFNKIITDLRNFPDQRILNVVFVLLVINPPNEKHYEFFIHEGVSFIMGYIIKHIYYEYYSLNILDINIGIGNLLFNSLSLLADKDLTLFGYGDDDIFTSLAKSYFNLGMIDIEIFHHFSQVNHGFDCIIGHYPLQILSPQAIKELCKTITDSLQYINDGGYFLLLTDADLMIAQLVELAKENVDLQIRGLVKLPTFFSINQETVNTIIIAQASPQQEKEIVLLNLSDNDFNNDNLDYISQLDSFINEIIEEEI